MKDRLNAIIEFIKLYVTRHKSLCAGAAGAIVIILVIINIVSCSVRNSSTSIDISGSGLLFDSSLWKENEDGFKYYDAEGYTNTFGIDISEWVEDVDFKALKTSGVDFVILRVGYRGYETGKFVLDSNLSTYLKDAQKAGVKIGAYFVSQAIDEAEAIEEAQYVMDQLSGFTIEMPLYIDLEAVYDTARTDDLTVEERTAIAVAFCKAVEENGYRGGVYANEVWFTDMMNYNEIAQYDIWLANYRDTLITDVPINMWQFSSEGLVDGCDKWVDLNVRVTKEEETTIEE